VTRQTTAGSSKQTYRLGDEALAFVVQSVQAALMTGVDISDLLRGLALEEAQSGVMEPSVVSIETFNRTMEQMSDLLKSRVEADREERTGSVVDGEWFEGT
jgi:hypothetical protein